MLSEAAISLIADVFGHKDLFRDLPRVQSRWVQWGSDAPPVKLPHSAVVVSEQTLLDHLRPQAGSIEHAESAGWQVFSSRPLPPAASEERFGSRVARAWAVELRNSDTPGCWIESVEDGWLFLIGREQGAGWLLSVGGATLEASRLIAKQIGRRGESGGEFPAYPCLLSPLCGWGGAEAPWLACGAAAIAFDPICGDGTAHAVREAILAAAVIRAISGGAPAQDVFAHYEARLTAGFQRHLAECAGFYRTGGTSAWWTTELAAIERGLGWCQQRMAAFPGFRFRLNGYELEAVA
jgi:hypothetical protein